MNPQRVGVVGLGLLGRGIAACFLGHGFEVVALDHDQQAVTAARDHISHMMDELVDFGGFDAALRQDWPGRYFPTADYSALRDCSFIVESVLEDVATKDKVFDQIEAVVDAKATIASNSSAIPISQLQPRRRYPERFLAMHWAEPAHATRFMEVIRGEKTSEATIEATLTLARRLGKEPSLLHKEIPGFIVNRIGYAMYREVLSLIEAGVADAETIDRSMRNALGLWATVCGPFRWIDITGGPELYAKAFKHVLPTLNNSPGVPPVLQKLAESGARGTINGRGFYQYTPEEARHWHELYRRHAWRVAQMQNEYFPQEKTPLMNSRAAKLEALGYPIDKRTPEGALVDPLAITGKILYASGQVPFDGDQLTSKGKVPSQVSVEEATRASALCAANILRAVNAHAGGLENIQRVVRITGYVNADADFTDCHLVINGASRLVRDVFGESGRHARTALSMAQLPLGASVEVEMIFELKS